MKPAMVDATLVKKNINGAKKKGKRSHHELLLEGGNDPLDLSRASALPAGEEIFEDSSTQLFYVYNPPTQTYEPVTIISLGDDGVSGVEEHVIHHHNELLHHESQIVNNIHTDHEEIVQTCDQVAGEVIVCNTYGNEVEREEIVDSVKEEYVGPTRPEHNQS